MDMPTPVSTEVKGIFVDNRWPTGTSGRAIPVVAPAEGRAFPAIAAGEAAVVDAAVRAARGIRAGQVDVNAFGAGGGIELPFGGMGKSGHGRERDLAVPHDVPAPRTTIVKHG